MPKLTQQDFKKRVRQKYGDRFEIISSYHGLHQNIKIKCKKCGWTGTANPQCLLYTNYGSKCPKHGHQGVSYSSITFQRKVNQVHNNQFEILSAYKGVYSRVKIKCKKCGWVGESLPTNILRSGYGSKCPKHPCFVNYNTDTFMKKMNKRQHNQYALLSKYHGYNRLITVKCKQCGVIFDTTPATILTKRVGKNCNHYCAFNFKQASEWLSKKTSKKIKLVNFSSMNKKAEFLCLTCGEKWQTQASNVFNSESGCPNCAKSKGEKAVTEYLKKKGYHFEPQFRIEECRDKQPLPFDFVVRNKDNSLNCLIEYQGCQHFIDPSQYCKGDFINKKSVLITQKHDAMKLSFCQKHGIKLIYINHPQTTSESNKHSFIANLVKRTLDKELKVS